MEKKVKPLVLSFNTAKDQANYFFNREFQGVALSLVEQSWGEESHEMVVMPSDEVILKEFFDNRIGEKDEYIADFLGEPRDLEEDEVPAFVEWATNHPDFEDYKYGDFQANHYPMWGTVWRCDEFYVDSDYMTTDKLYNLGIGVCQDRDGDYYLFIAGAGYDFYSAHWIPLFSALGWIEYED